jgi:hypothetical protein
MPTSLTAIAFLAVLVVPGVVFASVFNRNNAFRNVSDLRFLIAALTTSLAIHAIFLPWTWRVYLIWDSEGISTNLISAAWVWAVTVLLFAPVAAGIILSRLADWNSPRMQRLLSALGLSIEGRAGSCWEWLFYRPQPCWMIIEFKDGHRLAGKFGEGSRIVSAPGGGPGSLMDIYLEELWELSGDTFVQALQSNPGAWINASEVKTVRIYRT